MRRLIAARSSGAQAKKRAAVESEVIDKCFKLYFFFIKQSVVYRILNENITDASIADKLSNTARDKEAEGYEHRGET